MSQDIEKEKDWSISSSKTTCKVINSKILDQCGSKPHIPMGKTGPLIAKIPVVLSEQEVEIDIETEINLEESASDIETVDKQVFLTECNLIPCTDKLFIEGFVEKTIKHRNTEQSEKGNTGGILGQIKINLPFKCVTEVTFSRQPVYGENYKKRLNAADPSTFCKSDREDSWIHFRKYHEPVCCELISGKIAETDSYFKGHPQYGFQNNEKTIKGITCRMTVTLCLILLQSQFVCIPEPMKEVLIIDGQADDRYYDRAEKLSGKYTELEVGYDPEKGLIGKAVASREFSEE